MSSNAFPVAFRMENYSNLFYKLALRCWKNLPSQHQTWISVEDLIQDGMLFIRYKVVPKYNVRLKMSFITLLHISLEQFYSRKLAAYYAKKRLPIDLTYDEDVRFVDVLSSTSAIDNIYDQASPLLRQYMDKWFYDTDGLPERLRISDPFKKARREFKRLAKVNNVDVVTCRTVLESRKQKSLQ